MKIAFDYTLMRPGCALLQAMYGCDWIAATEFNAESWLLVPTENLQLYEIDEKQLSTLISRVNALFPMKSLSRRESEG